MKYFFVIVTLTGLLLQTFGKGLVLAEFMLNQEYVARVLCVNKSKPELGCNGQCYLMKQMEKETKKEQSGTAVKDKYEVVIAAIDVPSAPQPYFTVIRLSAAYRSGSPVDPLVSIFHPPRA